MSRREPPLTEPSQQTDDGLYDILIHVDRQAYPDRYQAVRDEYVRRHGESINGQPVDAYFDRVRKSRPFAERSRFKKRLLIGLALWSLLMLAIKAGIYLFSHGRGP